MNDVVGVRLQIHPKRQGIVVPLPDAQIRLRQHCLVLPEVPGQNGVGSEAGIDRPRVHAQDIGLGPPRESLREPRRISAVLAQPLSEARFLPQYQSAAKKNK